MPRYSAARTAATGAVTDCLSAQYEPITVGRLCVETGIPTNRIRQILRQLEVAGGAIRVDRYLWVAA